MRLVLPIAASALITFALVFSAILLAWYSASGEADCRGDSCALEWAALVSMGALVSALAAAVAGLVVFVALRTRRGPTHRRPQAPS